jgi:hypothetical protein
MNNFISKYHDSHNITNYRLIKTNENGLSHDLIKDVLNKIGIDLLCIAAHYSERYTNSDNYLITKADEQVKQYALFFSQNTTDKIVDSFIKHSIDLRHNVELKESNNTLSWKNMHYIWKLYLSSIRVPNMMYTNNLKDIFKSKLAFTESIEDNINKEPVFLNVTSKFLPSVSSFMSFWDKHVTIINTIVDETMVDDGTILNETIVDDEYEIDEIASLYKISDYKSVPISDKDIIKMIHHYFSPQVEVIDNKYITNICCNLWSKHDEILKFLDAYKNNIKKKNDLISFDELYKSYKSFHQVKQLADKGSTNRLVPIVSKQFLEKYVCQELNEYIKYEKFVSSEWNNH